MNAATPWTEVRALFDELLSQPREARATRLAQVSPVLAQEAAELLDQHEAEERAGGRFLSQPPGLAWAFETDLRGLALGPWRLVSRIGGGGMGEVWLAERADGRFQAQAAVKLLRSGVDSGSLMDRFAQERQALARLNHPHIARLLDAGSTPEGQPFVVMEFVSGQRLDVAVRSMGLDARLALFLQLAEAVAYAHRKLLLHRDLKPANVLVDTEGQVKLLDFGIAKILDPLAWGEGDATVAGERPFTPQYASPEQIRGEPLGPASDVYSLGVMLHELLTGVRPVGRQARNSAEVIRAVLEESPQAPSHLPAGQVQVQHWNVWRHRLAGDLDHIVLRSIDRDPECRYASVHELLVDLRAHLEGRPLASRPSTAVHVLHLFLRRNPLAAAAAAVGSAGLVSGVAASVMQGHALTALGIVALGAGMGLALWNGLRAEAARRRAERHVQALSRLANRVVFDYHDGIKHLPGSVAVRQSMLTDTVTYLSDMESLAEGDPRMAYDLARMAHRLALLEGATFNEGLEANDRADVDFGRALRLVELACAAEAPDATVLLECASIVADAAEFDQRLGRLGGAAGATAGRDALSGLLHARELTRRAQAIDPFHPNLHELLGTLEGRLGRLLGHTLDANLGRWDEARPHLEASVLHMRQFAAGQGNQPEGLRQLTWALIGLSTWHRLAGDPEQGLQLVEEAWAAIHRAEVDAPGHKVYENMATMVLTHWAAAMGLLGRVDEGVVKMQEAMRRQREAMAADPANAMGSRDLALMQVALGRLLVEGGRAADAYGPLMQADPVLRALPNQGTDAYVTRWCAEASILLARAALEGRGEPQQASARVAETLDTLSGASALRGTPDLLQVLRAQAQSVAAEAMQRLGRSTEAHARWKQALAHWDAVASTGQGLPRAYVQRREAIKGRLSEGLNPCRESRPATDA